MEIFSFLVFDIFLDEFIGDGTTGDGAVASGPEVSPPEDLCQMRVVAQKRVSALALEVLHHVADGEFRGVGDGEMDMVRSNLPRDDVDVDLGTESSYETTHGLPQFACEYPFPVLGNPDEVHFQIMFGVAAGVIRPRHGSNSTLPTLDLKGRLKAGVYTSHRVGTIKR